MPPLRNPILSFVIITTANFHIDVAQLFCETINKKAYLYQQAEAEHSSEQYDQSPKKKIIHHIIVNVG